MLKLTWKMENIQITFLKLKSNSQKVNKAWRQTSDELPSLRFLTQPCGDAVPAPFRAMKAQKKPDEDVNVHLGLGGRRAGNIFRSFGSWRCFLELNFLWNHQQKILIQLFNRGGAQLAWGLGKLFLLDLESFLRNLVCACRFRRAWSRRTPSSSPRLCLTTASSAWKVSALLRQSPLNIKESHSGSEGHRSIKRPGVRNECVKP